MTFLSALLDGVVRRHRDNRSDRVESGDRRSRLPVAVLMCVAMLTFLNPIILFKLFFVYSEAVPSETYLEYAPSDSKCVRCLATEA